MRIPERYPVNGTFELTVRCNLRCRMCLFRHDSSEDEAIKARELTAGQWIDLAGQVAECGTVKLLITGGEPMLRPDFCEIWEGIYRQGFLLELYTNGTLVTPKIMETLRRYPPHKIGVTLYGTSEETYEKVCGNGAMFHRALAGFHELVTLPSKLEFRTTIIKDNRRDFEEMHELIRREFGEQYRLIHTRLVTQSVRGACADVKACRLEPEENVALSFARSIQLIRDYVGEENFDPSLVGYEKKDCCTDNCMSPKASLFGCEAGMSQYTISWDGKLLGCQMLDLFHTNPMESGFAEAWEAYPMTVRLPEPDPDCLSCRNQDLCNCCAASRYAETGSLSGKPAYVCQDVAAMARTLRRTQARRPRHS